MKKLSSIIALFSVITTSFAFASSPLTIVNNTHMRMDIQFSHCNDNNKCTFLSTIHLDKKGSSNNSISLMYPAGMENIDISSANTYDQNSNHVASLNNSCHANSSASNAIIIDSFGTSKLFCLYS